MAKIYISEKPLKSGYKNMLIFFNIFLNIFPTYFFKHFKVLKFESSTWDMYILHFHISTLRTKIKGGPPPPSVLDRANEG